MPRSAELIGKQFNVSPSVIAAFIDAKVYITCRPSFGQEAIYNGKDRVHGLKWQSVLDCFGLYCHWYGGKSSRRHDAFIYLDSGVCELLDNNLDGMVLGIYGDAAYPRSNRLLKPFLGEVTREQTEFNRWWSVLRIVVEWGFSKHVALFPLIEMKKKKKIQLSPVAKLVDAAAFFTNCHTLLYGSEVASYFNTRDQMPSLESYFV